MTVVGAEPVAAYNRVLLSSLLGGEVDEAGCGFKPRSWYEENGIRLMTGAPVTAIDRENGLAIVGETHVLPFDKLVLAIGSLPIRLPLPGGDLPGGDVEAFLADLLRERPLLPEALLRRLVRAYGTRVHEVLGAARTPGELGRDLGGGLTEAELDHLVRREWARSAEDVLWRRTKLGLHAPPGTADEVAARLRVPA